MRLLVISQSLVQRVYQERWRRLAAVHPGLQVRLLIPRRWIDRESGPEKVFEGRAEQNGNFEVRTVAMTSESNTSIYLVRGLARELRDFAPDVIFPVHCNYQLAQTVVWRGLFARHARLLFFTMGVHDHPSRMTFRLNPKQMLFEVINWIVWQLTKHGTHAAMCHNPDIERCMRVDGYRPPILVQTQIGVNEEVFRPDEAGRRAARAQLGLDGFVVGFAGRITADKGIMDIAAAMPLLPPDVRLLVIGDGPDRARLEQMSVTAGWRDRLHLTGYVPPSDVAVKMRAMDCFVLGSRTTPTWTDTFPLVVAQAMATGLPVVGSDSGAIPFQLDGKGMIFHEGDAVGLADHVRRLHGDAGLRRQMGQVLLTRARAEFCINGMNGRLYALIEALAGNQSTCPDIQVDVGAFRTPTCYNNNCTGDTRQDAFIDSSTRRVSVPCALNSEPHRLPRITAAGILCHGAYAMTTLRRRLEQLCGYGYPSYVDRICTHMTRNEKQTLYRLARRLPRGSAGAEIGSYHGASSCCLAAGLQRRGNQLWCIDTWMNDAVSDGRKDILPIWQQNTAPLAGTIQAVRGYSHDVVAAIPDGLSLLFVDGDHSYEGVARDLHCYLPKLRPNAVLILHDWNHDSVKHAVVNIVHPHETARLVVLPNLYCCRVRYQTER